MSWRDFTNTFKDYIQGTYIDFFIYGGIVIVTLSFIVSYFIYGSEVDFLNFLLSVVFEEKELGFVYYIIVLKALLRTAIPLWILSGFIFSFLKVNKKDD